MNSKWRRFGALYSLATGLLFPSIAECCGYGLGVACHAEERGRKTWFPSHTADALEWEVREATLVSVDVELNLMKTFLFQIPRRPFWNPGGKRHQVQVWSLWKERLMGRCSQVLLLLLKGCTSTGLRSMSNYFFREEWLGRHICFVLWRWNLRPCGCWANAVLLSHPQPQPLYNPNQCFHFPLS